MRKYDVAVERCPKSSLICLFDVINFICEIPEGQPVNRDTLYELINRDREINHKTGKVIAWSRIEEE